jgi:hypothetical protein
VKINQEREIYLTEATILLSDEKNSITMSKEHKLTCIYVRMNRNVEADDNTGSTACTKRLRSAKYEQ